MQIIKPDVNINFVGRRKIAYGLSLVMLLASIISLVVHGGPRYGIDFASGAEVLVSFDAPTPIEAVKETLQTIDLDGSVVQRYGQSDDNWYRILIKSELAETSGLTELIKDALGQTTAAKVVIESFEMVGPQVSRDLQEKALLAMFFALLFITVYI